MSDPSASRRTSRRYWAQRHGENAGAISLPIACRLFRSIVESFRERDYFQEWFGFYCIDLEWVAGLAGADEAAFALRKTRLDGIWPVADTVEAWDELHLMTAVEFVHDFISKPVSGTYHSYNNCGWHYEQFDAETAQEEFRTEVNEILVDLGDGFELDDGGQVVRLSPSGLDSLVAAAVPASTNQLIKQTIDDAIRKFRSRGSSPRDRRDAVRDLVGVLELLRPKLKLVLDEPDEDALFNIANNFALRHENSRQRRSYDPAIWLSWMFYFYLATIHAGLRLIERSETAADKAPDA